jgi:hypothetical protein
MQAVQTVVTVGGKCGGSKPRGRPPGSKTRRKGWGAGHAPLTNGHKGAVRKPGHGRGRKGRGIPKPCNGHTRDAAPGLQPDAHVAEEEDTADSMDEDDEADVVSVEVNVASST